MKTSRILCHTKFTKTCKHKEKVVIKIESGRINEAIYTTHVPFSYIYFFVKNSFINSNNIGFYVKLWPTKATKNIDFVAGNII